MKVLFATSEAAPFVKTGGLGDVAGSLPAALNEKGVDARVILPLYNCIPQEYKDKMKYIDHIYIDMAWRKQYVGVFELEYNGCKFYFIDNEFYFNGDKPYDFIHLDCEKFIFFSKAVLSILPTIDFRPDVNYKNFSRNSQNCTLAGLQNRIYNTYFYACYRNRCIYRS